MSIPEPASQGVAPFHQWQTWFRISGDLTWPKAPIVVLHGGPGAAHNYLLRIARLAEQRRPVIHYDQLGVGNSTHLPDRGADFWTVNLFLEELDNLTGYLGISDRYYVLGQSWGGMLAAEHAVRRPAGLGGLVLANSPASMPLWRQEADRLRAQLPTDVQRVLAKHEANGTTDHPDYKKAERAFEDLFVCRVSPRPAESVASHAATDADPTVYHTMNGPSEFHVIGSLRNWSIIDRAARIDVPTLLINGRYDEATALTVRPFADNIPDVRWEVFEQSSHSPHIEEEERYLRVVGDFFDYCDSLRRANHNTGSDSSSCNPPTAAV